MATKSKKEKISISKCEICKGIPTTEPFSIPEFTGTICTICGTIISYDKNETSK